MPTKRKARKKWTFMVCLAGDNNLDNNGVADLKEMKKVGSTDAVNIIAEFDRAGAKLQTKRFFLKKKGTIDADAVMKLGETDCGDPKHLVDFVKWGARNYPADHYALILWNHGNGWDDTDVYASDRYRSVQRVARGPLRFVFFRSSLHKSLVRAATDVVAKGILYDDNARNFLDNVELKKAINKIANLLKGKLDLLGMDACLMSMAEVAYQVHDGVSWLVGSEETEPVEGWPYNTILAELVKNPEMDSRDLSGVIVDKYVDSYTQNDGVTQSALNLQQSKALADDISRLADALSAGLNENATMLAIMQARNQAQSYDTPENIDLIDFCRWVQKYTPASSQAFVESQRLIEASTREDGIIFRSASKGPSMKDSNGLAIYFPTKSVSSLYENLDFAQNTHWLTFLKKYVTITRARPD